MLLTGKDPTSLYDAYSNTWKWESYAQVSDRMKAILNRMLMLAASDRFQSAEEVLAALQTPPRQRPTSPTPPTPPTSPPRPNQPIAKSPAAAPLSTLELLRGAALTGFEGGLLAIALVSLLGTALGSGFWLVLLGILGFLQWRRIMDWKDVLILSAITLAGVVFLPALRQLSLGAAPLLLPLSQVLFVAVMVGLGAIAVTALFKLIYNLVSKIL
jgi:serine/threonine-protein kinase